MQAPAQIIQQNHMAQLLRQRPLMANQQGAPRPPNIAHPQLMTPAQFHHIQQAMLVNPIVQHPQTGLPMNVALHPQAQAIQQQMQQSLSHPSVQPQPTGTASQVGMQQPSPVIPQAQLNQPQIIPPTSQTVPAPPPAPSPQVSQSQPLPSSTPRVPQRTPSLPPQSPSHSVAVSLTAPSPTVAEQPPVPRHISPGGIITRLIQFADLLGPSEYNKDYDFWKRMISEHFSETAAFRYTIWHKTYQESRAFELPSALIARFYQIQFESGVTRIQLSLSTPKEYTFKNAFMVEVPRASVITYFADGTHIISNGYLRVMFTLDMKIEDWELTTSDYTEFIPRAMVAALGEKDRNDNNNDEDQLNRLNSTSLPTTTVNDYGIPMKLMRCLEVSEVVDCMKDLMQICETQNVGPMAALTQFSQAAENGRLDELLPPPGVSSDSHSQISSATTPHAVPMQMSPMQFLPPATSQTTHPAVLAHLLRGTMAGSSSKSMSHMNGMSATGELAQSKSRRNSTSNAPTSGTKSRRRSSTSSSRSQTTSPKPRKKKIKEEPAN
ncbi:LIM-domain binding protein-domain-containing protein [Paraphysoderma sedebokerense]|nr:LIM-domain binding protein-domain-containing protein [Paraphysoderma sedebokerense]